MISHAQSTAEPLAEHGNEAIGEQVHYGGVGDSYSIYKNLIAPPFDGLNIEDPPCKKVYNPCPPPTYIHDVIFPFKQHTL